MLAGGVYGINPGIHFWGDLLHGFSMGWRLWYQTPLVIGIAGNFPFSVTTELGLITLIPFKGNFYDNFA